MLKATTPCLLHNLPLPSIYLRILDIHGTKITKNQTPLTRFAQLFYNQTVYQKSERCFFDQVSKDDKSVLTFEKCPLVAELKLKTPTIVVSVTF